MNKNDESGITNILVICLFSQQINKESKGYCDCEWPRGMYACSTSIE